MRIEHGPGEQATDADFCICTLPLPILETIPSDFSPAKKAAIRSSPDYLRSVKLAFEAPRFWETDDFIFGGLAWTDRTNENVIYPSDRYGAATGVIVGAYCAGWTNQDNPDAFARLSARGAHSHQPRFDRGAASRTIAPPRQACLGRVGARALFGRASVPSGATSIRGRALRAAGAVPDMPSCSSPKDPIVFAGEHLSYQPTWQEGAAMSAHDALQLVHAMAREKVA